MKKNHISERKQSGLWRGAGKCNKCLLAHRGRRAPPRPTEQASPHHTILYSVHNNAVLEVWWLMIVLYQRWVVLGYETFKAPLPPYLSAKWWQCLPPDASHRPARPLSDSGPSPWPPKSRTRQLLTFYYVCKICVLTSLCWQRHSCYLGAEIWSN